MQKSFFKKFFIEASAERQARSIAWGACIAFSPFIGLHTVMTIVLAALFNLNFTLTLLVSCTINNPWTMIPIYLGDYFFGSIVLPALFPFFTWPENPKFMGWLEDFFYKKLGIVAPSLWAFLVGGTLVSIFVGFCVYFLIRYIQYTLQKKTDKSAYRDPDE